MDNPIYVYLLYDNGLSPFENVMQVIIDGFRLPDNRILHCPMVTIIIVPEQGALVVITNPMQLKKVSS